MYVCKLSVSLSLSLLHLCICVEGCWLKLVCIKLKPVYEARNPTWTASRYEENV